MNDCDLDVLNFLQSAGCVSCWFERSIFQIDIIKIWLKLQITKLIAIKVLQQTLYLEVDFVRTFGFAKDIFWESLDTPPLFSCNEIVYCSSNRNVSKKQSNKLRGVVSAIPSYKVEAMDRTFLISLTIDTDSKKPIQQRHPAVSSGAHLDSPWFLPITLAFKSRLRLDARKALRSRTLSPYHQDTW